MKKVISHKYAISKGTNLYSQIDGTVECLLEGGTWIGVVSESNGWYHVNTAQHDGWVKSDQTMDAKPYTLSAKVSAKVSGMIQNYILL